jgi:hypothetical protein
LHHVGDQAIADKIGATANEGVRTDGGGREPGLEINLLEFEAELDARTRGEEGLANQGNGLIESSSGRLRAAARDVEFLEDCQTARTQMLLEFAKDADRIGMVHEVEMANDGIEGLVEGEFGSIAFEEAGIAEAAELGTRKGPLEGRSEAVRADDFAAGANEIGDQEGDITGSAADIEDSHAGNNSSLLKELASERFEGLRWTTEAKGFLLGVAESRGGALGCGRVHGSLRTRIWSGLAGKADCNRKWGEEVRSSGGGRAQKTKAKGGEKMKRAKMVYWVACIRGALALTLLYSMFAVIGWKDLPARNTCRILMPDGWKQDWRERPFLEML